MFVNGRRKNENQYKKMPGPLTSNSCHTEGAWRHILFDPLHCILFVLSFNGHFVFTPMHFFFFFWGFHHRPWALHGGDFILKEASPLAGLVSLPWLWDPSVLPRFEGSRVDGLCQSVFCQTADKNCSDLRCLALGLHTRCNLKSP